MEEKLTPKQLMARITSNAMVILGDVVDLCVKYAEEYADASGKTIRQDTKRYLKAAARNAHMAGMAIRETSRTTQENIGDDSDVLFALLMLSIDRTTGQTGSMRKLYEIFKQSYPSLMHLNLDRIEHNTFGCLIDDYKDTSAADTQEAR